MPTDDFDRELQAALDASAAEAGAGATLLIGSQRSVSRKCMAQREDKHAFIKPTDGTIYQIGTLNQFHVELQRITRENKGPAAICGYIVCAYARLLEQFLSKIDGDLLPENVQGICDILTDMNKVEPELRRVFTEIQDARLALSMSASESEYGQTETLSKWVANYEIGDFLSLHSRSLVHSLSFTHSFILIRRRRSSAAAVLPAVRRGVSASHTHPCSHRRCPKVFWYRDSRVSTPPAPQTPPCSNPLAVQSLSPPSPASR